MSATLTARSPSGCIAAATSQSTPPEYEYTRSAPSKLSAKRERIAPSFMVFERGSNTASTRSPGAESFDGADRVYSYSGGVDWDVAAAMQTLGERAVNVSDIGTLTNTLVANARRGDHIIIMSNGAFGGIHQRVLDQLQHAHSQQG